MLCELRQVTKTYDDANAVTPIRNLDLSLKRGDFVSVNGDSGVGKSTLLFLVGGMLKPTSGEILFQGKEYGQMTDAQLSHLRAGNIGYISQNVQLAQALTIEENIRLAQKIALQCGSDYTTTPQIDFIIRYLGLEEKRDELPAHLSGGQKRRAMIAVTWARNPQLLLLDEPTNDLDEHWCEKIMELIETWRDAGKALLLVTHNQEYAMRAQTCLKLVNGALV